MPSDSSVIKETLSAFTGEKPVSSPFPVWHRPVISHMEIARQTLNGSSSSMDADDNNACSA
jgi:hypothetical protein